MMEQSRHLGYLCVVASLAVAGSAPLAEQARSGRPSAPRPAVLKVARVFRDVSRPKRVLTDPAGNIYVLSEGDHSIAVYDDELALQRRIGRIGNAAGELHGPTDMSIQGDRIWVADFRNDRIQEFSTAGTYVRSFPVRQPLSVAAVGRDQIAVVARSDDSLAKIYDLEGHLLRSLSGPAEQTPGVSKRQEAFFNRGRVFADPDGGLAFVFTFLLQPRLRWYDPVTGEVTKELRVEPPSGATAGGAAFSKVLADAAIERRDAVRLRNAKAASTLNAMAFDPRDGSIWVAPAAPVLYRFSSTDGTITEFLLRDDDDNEFGAHDLMLTPDGKRLFLIASIVCMTADLPN